LHLERRIGNIIEVLCGKGFPGVSKGKSRKNFGGRIMITRKSAILLLVTAACISAMLLVGVGARRLAAVDRRSPRERVPAGRDARWQNHKARRFGKITVPAEVSLALASSSKPGGPVTILVSASSEIPVRSGTLTLKVPDIGDAPAERQVLWSGTPSDFVAESAEFVIDVLPEGEYHFGAIFEFTPESDTAGELFASKSLYLDVRPDKVLSSNVSFDQIKRVELWNELEQRVLTDLRQDSRAAGLKATARAAETLDRDVIARRIAKLKASDPDVARRIMELNRVKAVPAGQSYPQGQRDKPEPDRPRRHLRSQPLSDRAVPVPERFTTW
jgi:hypothetical protein